MITALHISNYALIDTIDIEFGPGLNIVTGETGSGKSIVLGALSLLMGERADTRTIRDSNRKTVVEARFDISGFTGINEWLDDNDIDTEADTCILRRELTVRGTSRAFINDTPVNLATMRTVSAKLLDIHTQHENLLLADPDFQLRVLDSMACNESLLSQYRTAFAEYRKCLRLYTGTRDEIKRIKAESEYNQYLLSQLDALDLKPGEQEQLEHERDIVANVAHIKAHLTSALDKLSRSDVNALSVLSGAEAELARVAEFVDDISSLSERLSSARIDIADIVETLEEYDATLTASPSDLDDIERRLGEIYSLQARHNVNSGNELVAIREDLRNRLAAAENSEDLLNELEEKARAAKKNAVILARQLTAARNEAATILGAQIKERAIPMGMTNLRCEIRVTADKLGPTGQDSVEFLFAFNKNQSLMPVGKTASGGEIARVILALKSIMVEKMKLPTVIFDEVDTGVSGDVANRMAELMLKIARTTQVITITHIATVAAHGDRHFKVYKRDEQDTTNTHISLLDTAARERELATMIAGNPDDPVAVATARALLGNCQTVR